MCRNTYRYDWKALSPISSQVPQQQQSFLFRNIKLKHRGESLCLALDPQKYPKKSWVQSVTSTCLREARAREGESDSAGESEFGTTPEPEPLSRTSGRPVPEQRGPAQ